MTDFWAIAFLCVWFFGLLGAAIYDILFVPLTDEEIESLGVTREYLLRKRN